MRLKRPTQDRAWRKNLDYFLTYFRSLISVSVPKIDTNSTLERVPDLVFKANVAYHNLQYTSALHFYKVIVYSIISFFIDFFRFLFFSFFCS